MSLLDRLRAWWQGITGRNRTDAEESADAAVPEGETVADAATPEYECRICGTAVDDPEGPCPLCNSTDVVATAGAEPTSAEEGAGAVRTDVAESDADEAASKLSKLRETGELLDRHRDRWQPTDGGFRVELPEGDRVVDSREAVAELLSERYGSSGERE